MEISLAALADFAGTFVAALPPSSGAHAHVVGLSGELGAGKTTFVQAVAKVLGVKESVTSPTFVIAQRYKTAHPVFTNLVHVDAYRLSPKEKDTVGFCDYVKNPNNLILVEWPENMSSMVCFPKNAPVMEFSVIDEKTRNVSHA